MIKQCLEVGEGIQERLIRHRNRDSGNGERKVISEEEGIITTMTEGNRANGIYNIVRESEKQGTT